MKSQGKKFAIKKYWHRFRYLFLGFYQTDFIRTNSKEIQDSILVGTGMIVLSSVIQFLLLDTSITDEDVRLKILYVRISFILFPVSIFLYLRRSTLIINRYFGNYLTALITILLFLHIPLMIVNPSNHAFYLLNSSVILLGSSVILWMEPIRIAYITLGFILFLIPISVKIDGDLGLSPQTTVQNVLSISIIIFISFIANTMINYWRFEEFRSNRRLKRTLKNLVKINKKIRILSHQDSLTDLYNRRFLLESFDSHVKLSQTENFCFGLIILDLDYLKTINDKYGHIQGDRVIKKFAEIVKRFTNSNDIIARIGGDEFCILTHEITQPELKRLIERIREQISSIKMKVYNNPMLNHGITASIGAIFIDHNLPKNFDILYHRIDEALYQAKMEGRNKAIMVDF